jgi:threonine dehydratase
MTMLEEAERLHGASQRSNVTGFSDESADDLNITAIQTARTRISRHIKFTPVMDVVLRAEDGRLLDMRLKLENLQVTGAFKARGALNKAITVAEERSHRGLVAGSGGNLGPAVAYAGRLVGLPTTIVVPVTTSVGKVHDLEAMGARVLTRGRTWYALQAAAEAIGQDEALAYVHPFADPVVMAGHGTIGLEILERVPDLTTVVVPVGGGGLASGVAAAVKALRPDIRVVGVQETEYPLLSASFRAGQVIDLPPDLEASPLLPRQTNAVNLRLIRKHVDELVLVNESQLVYAAHLLWSELDVRATRSAASAVAAVLSGIVPMPVTGSACAIVCGRGAAGLF